MVFDRRQRELQRRVESPILETRAYQRFAALALDPANQYRFGLGAGDFLLYDNWRMLHARTGFTGARWVRGVSFDPPG